ncbi:2-amino-4-hydroxy-6-hydroxymethyldihydropteridine diphosphokinase [Anoxybacter fermentans]|uniref:2-amino-4-hydroxy-6-hydroxymethyldihydropteridine diphosphokinase n=1 Tax=Anoxybacter fermentans TaxID=1323375 RepID=A0A3S9SYT0_9FIRM|nr:2-amino-4-hydroxy-6-hydroxymethyldihydropteridine diphosphokinase [Anoxybacter fermentans]AZR73418.1 2-amino-4-hydroxy-6-hydroxymethyldihydropteridine diphosphokinase [Anoxybacter fermentans]
MSSAYLGLGTNMGDKIANLKKAVELIKNFDNTKIVKISKVYETEPWGYINQENFLNLCLKIDTDLSPYQLLAECQRVENELKRKRLIKWGPRTIDVDILLYDGVICNDEKLIIPHPRIHERAFVLIPLRDINERLIIKGKNVKEWIEIVGEEGVKEYSGKIEFNIDTIDPSC